MELYSHIREVCRKGENTEVEFKSCKGGLSQSMWETYSSFANTNGGIIVLGIKEKDNKFYPDELTSEQVTKYKKLYWDDVHNRNKVSACLTIDTDVFDTEYEGSHLLIVRVPRAHYSKRPVYLTQNPFGHTYVRRHEGDYLLSDDEVRKMFSDANIATHPLDGKIYKHFTLEKNFDATTIRQYRQVFNLNHEGHAWIGLSDMDFFKKIGGYVTDAETGEEGFTLAAVLMFGLDETILSALPHFYVDFREKLSNNPDIRWTDRIHPDGNWVANLYQFHRRVYMKMAQSLPVPFKLEGLQRIDDTPAHKALREAIVNTIIHARLNSMHCIVIEHYPDRFVFRNPGCLLIPVEQYFEGGTSICRNSILQKMFEFIGEGERAGSGVDTIKKGWKENGWAEPQVREIYDPEQVELTLYLGSTAANTTKKTTKKTTEKTTEKILAALKSNPHLSNKELAELCGITEDGIYYNMRKLKESGQIRRVGPDKGGHWEIIDAK